MYWQKKKKEEEEERLVFWNSWYVAYPLWWRAQLLTWPSRWSRPLWLHASGKMGAPQTCREPENRSRRPEPCTTTETSTEHQNTHTHTEGQGSEGKVIWCESSSLTLSTIELSILRLRDYSGRELHVYQTLFSFIVGTLAFHFLPNYLFSIRVSVVVASVYFYCI